MSSRSWPENSKKPGGCDLTVPASRIAASFDARKLQPWFKLCEQFERVDRVITVWSLGRPGRQKQIPWRNELLHML
jgi:hypothetical protein